MYKFIRIRHDILIQWHWKYIIRDEKKFNYMLEIDILRNSSLKKSGCHVLRGAFEGFGCPKRHPDALLAKTMIQSLVEIKFYSLRKVVNIDSPRNNYYFLYDSHLLRWDGGGGFVLYW